MPKKSSFPDSSYVNAVHKPGVQLDDQSAILCIVLDISDEQFQQLIDSALGDLKGEHAKNIKNVAILFADDPTDEQRIKLQLLPYQSLYGLYEGTPLPFRQGQTHLFPDRITIFKHPMLQSVGTLEALKEQIKHTLWHEIAHYYGLDHDKIHELER